jgi:ECF sigma factor
LPLSHDQPRRRGPDHALLREWQDGSQDFGGLTVEETAAALAISPATVKRERALAKGWLYRELLGGLPDTSSS